MGIHSPAGNDFKGQTANEGIYTALWEGRIRMLSLWSREREHRTEYTPSAGDNTQAAPQGGGDTEKTDDHCVEVRRRGTESTAPCATCSLWCLSPPHEQGPGRLLESQGK